MSTGETRGLGRWAPGLAELRRYERGWLRGDVLAGVAVAAYLIPQVMAYAEVAGLPPVTGLWAISGSLIVYAILGSSRQLSVGPESTTALMTATAIAPFAAGDPGKYAGLAAALAIVVGALCIVSRLGKLGFLSDLLSKPVLVGYMAGVAVIMIVSQIGKVTRLDSTADSFLGDVAFYATHLGGTHVPTLLLAAGMLTVLLVVGRMFPRAPIPLIAMLLAIGVVLVFGLRQLGIEVVGTIPAGFPVPAVPDVGARDWSLLLLPAVGLAIVAYNDNILTARAFASRNRYAVDGNQELLALGAANVAAGVMQGFPVSSSGSRTAIGDSVKSRTQLYSLVALAVVVVTVLFLRPVLASFPTAALGAIVIYAAIRLIDLAELKRLLRFRRSEFVIAIATTVSVLVFDILYGILVAVGLSILNLLRRVARPHDAILGYVPGLAGMHDVDDYPSTKLVPGLVVYRYDSPLFFANAENFKKRALEAVDAAEQPVEWFVLNAEANVEVDITAVDALDELHEELERRGIEFAMARVKQDLRTELEAAGIVERVGEHRIFPTLPTAVQAYVEAYVERHGAPPEGVTIQEPPRPPV